jgi:hypothetical protein
MNDRAIVDEHGAIADTLDRIMSMANEQQGHASLAQFP